MRAEIARLPLRFERNDGQADPRVRYIAHGHGYAMFVSPSSAWLHVGRAGQTAGDTARNRRAVSSSWIEMQLPGANASAEMQGEGEQPGKSNYLIGEDRSKWRTNVLSYSKVRARNVWPGIDLVYYGQSEGQLEYDFVVSPGTDPAALRLKFAGIRELKLANDGALNLATELGSVTWRKPVAYQLIDDKRREVASRYTIAEDGTVSFQMGDYDRSAPLIVDPVLYFSTFVGGGSTDVIRAVAVDAAGNIYVAGYTVSNDLPTTPGGYSQVYVGGNDVFVNKLNSTATSLIYSTYVGGSGDDFANALAIDGNGTAYVGGDTTSRNFPTQGAVQSQQRGSNDGFVLALNSTGAGLIYSTLLGGVNFDQVLGVAVDAQSSLYAVGRADSGELQTTPNSFQPSHGGGTDAFVVKLNATGGVVYSSFLGGTGFDVADSVTVNPAGEAYLAGRSCSNGLATLGSYQYTQSNCDGLIARVSADGHSLVWSTYFGGTFNEEIYDIALDSDSNVYIAGETASSNLPLAGPIQTTHPGPCCWVIGFAAKLNPLGSGLIFSTYLGGTGDTRARSVAVDAAHNLYIAGETNAPDFPVANAIQPAKETTGGSLFRSTNAGGTWARAENSLLTTSFRALAYDPLSPQTVFAAANTVQVAKSADAGQTWLSSTNTGIGGTPQAIAVAPGGQTVYEATSNGVYVSTNGGTSWTQMNSGLANTNVFSVVVDPNNAATAYAGTNGGGIFKTVNGGANWTAVNTGVLNLTCNVLVAVNSTTIYAGTNAGVYVTVDAGQHWAPLQSTIGGGQITQIAVSPSAPATMYAAANGVVFQTTNGGTSWTRAHGTFAAGASAIAVDWQNPNVVYAALSERGMYKSADGGQTYARISNGLDGAAFPRAIVSIPNSGIVLFGLDNQFAPWLAKISPDGSQLKYSTYLGGSAFGRAWAVALDSAGNAYTGGETSAFDFPVTAGTLRTFPRGNDAWLAKVIDGPAACTYNVYADSTLFPTTGGTSQAKIIAPAGCSWTVQASDPTWIQFDHLTSGMGSAGINFTIPANTGATRTGSFTIGNQTVNITQPGSAACSYNLTSGNATFLGAGGTDGFTIVTEPGCRWQLYNVPAWVKINGPASGTGTGTVSLTVRANPLAAGRTVNMQITGNNFGTSFSVTQAGLCNYSILPLTTQNFPAAGGASSMQIFAPAGCPWQVTGNPTWIIPDVLGGTGNGTVNYTVAGNAVGTRSATLSAGGRNLSITQDATPAGCTYTLGPSSPATIGNTASTNTITVTASQPNCPWQAVSTVPWLKITAGAGGVGNGSVTYTATPNTTVFNRSANMNIAGRTYTVNQNQVTAVAPDFVSLSPFYGNAGTQTFTATYFDANAAADINEIHLLINLALSPAQACYVRWFRNGNQIQLLSDDASTAATGTPGVPGNLQNSRCSVDTGASSVTTSGNTVSLNAAITFKPGYTGKQNMFVQSVESPTSLSTWLLAGTWFPNTTGQLLVRYRLYNPATNEHLYTTDANEFNTLPAPWVKEGPIGRVYDAPATVGGAQTIPYWRVYRIDSGRHAWTSDRNEYIGLIRDRAHYSAEGADGSLIPVLPAPLPNTVPIYRLRHIGDYPPLQHWTSDTNEYNVLAGQGWQQEGIDGYMVAVTGPTPPPQPRQADPQPVSGAQ